jgi:hypothetical protein
MSEDLHKELAELPQRLGVSVEPLLGSPDQTSLHGRPEFVGNYLGLCTVRRCNRLRFFYLRRKFTQRPNQEWTQPFGLLLEPFGFVILG